MANGITDATTKPALKLPKKRITLKGEIANVLGFSICRSIELQVRRLIPLLPESFLCEKHLISEKSGSEIIRQQKSAKNVQAE